MTVDLHDRMTRVKPWGLIGLVALALGGCNFFGRSSRPSSPLASPSQPVAIASPATPQPELMKLQLKMAAQENLKTAQGKFIVAGQVLVDRSSERQQLESRRQKIQADIEAIAALEALPAPKTNLATQTAQIQQAKQQLQKAELAIQQFKDQSPYTDLAREYLPTERQKLAQLEAAKTAAQKDLATKIAQLQAAKTDQQGQSQLRQNSASQKTQLLQELATLEQQIKAAQDTLSPYDGLVQKLEWLKPEAETQVVALEIAAQPKAEGQIGPEPQPIPALAEPSASPTGLPALPTLGGPHPPSPAPSPP